MTNDADQTRAMVDKYGWKPLLDVHRKASLGESLDSLASLYGVSPQEADRMQIAGRHAARMRREQRAYEDAIRD